MIFSSFNQLWSYFRNIENHGLFCRGMCTFFLYFFFLLVTAVIIKAKSKIYIIVSFIPFPVHGIPIFSSLANDINFPKGASDILFPVTKIKFHRLSIGVSAFLPSLKPSFPSIPFVLLFSTA